MNNAEAKLRWLLSGKLLPVSKFGFVQNPDTCRPAFIKRCESMNISLEWKNRGLE
jgi:hypothetical protein